MATKLRSFNEADWKEWPDVLPVFDGDTETSPLIANVAGAAGTKMTVIVDGEGVYVCEEAGVDVYAVGLKETFRHQAVAHAEFVVGQLEAEVARGCDVPVIYGLLKLGFSAL